MKILVLSDSHKDIPSLRIALTSNSDAGAVIFLGDGVDDLDKFEDLLKNKLRIAVKGNCDSFFSPYPLKTVEKLQDTYIYCTHGHSEHVKYGLEELRERASQAGAKIALFGHTHIPYTDYKDGLYLLNPGSVRQNSCGIIEISEKGILCYTKPIVPKN